MTQPSESADAPAAARDPVPAAPFVVSEYDRATWTFIGQTSRALARASSALLSQLRSQTVERVATSPIVAPDGSQIENEPLAIAVELAVQMQDVVQERPDALAASIALSMAEQEVAQFEPRLLELIGRISDKFGNTVDAGGQTISHDLLLDVMEKMDFDVDEEGNPVGLAFVVSPKMAEQLRHLPPPTEQQEERHRRIIEERRRQSRARRRNRELPR
jgi:hypothetical protein